jgi:hypothetical protein
VAESRRESVRAVLQELSMDLFLIGMSWAVTAILRSSYRAKIVDEACVNKLEQGSNTMRWRLYLREIQ